MKPSWFPKVAHTPCGSRGATRGGNGGELGERGLGPAIQLWRFFRLRQIQFVLGISKCCQSSQRFGSLCCLCLSLSLYPLSHSLPTLPSFFPSFFCCSLNAQIEFICCEFPMHTKWNFVSCLGYTFVWGYMTAIYVSGIWFMREWVEICLCVCWEDIAALFGPLDGWKIIRFDFICIALTDLSGAPRCADARGADADAKAGHIIMLAGKGALSGA